MLDFEKLDGFVIDLSTEELVEQELKNVLDATEDFVCWSNSPTINDKREHILEYYIDNYKYVFCKSLNVYQICESELMETTIIINYYQKLLTERQKLLEEYYIRNKSPKKDDEINNNYQKTKAIDNILVEIGIIPF